MDQKDERINHIDNNAFHAEAYVITFQARQRTQDEHEHHDLGGESGES